jgi:hypothetical protein
MKPSRLAAWQHMCAGMAISGCGLHGATLICGLVANGRCWLLLQMRRLLGFFGIVASRGLLVTDRHLISYTLCQIEGCASSASVISNPRITAIYLCDMQ